MREAHQYREGNMTEKVENEEIVTTVSKEDFDNLQAQFKDLQEKYQLEESKKRQLLDEKKAEQEKRRITEAKAEEERLKQSGDIDALMNSFKQREKEWEDKFVALNSSIEKKEIRQAAMRIANSMNPLDGDAAEMLADYIERDLKISDGSLLFLDSAGQPSVMDEKQYIQNATQRNKFKHLIKGSQATGAGALGNNSANPAQKKLSEMSEKEQRELYLKDPAEWRRLQGK